MMLNPLIGSKEITDFRIYSGNRIPTRDPRASDEISNSMEKLYIFFIPLGGHSSADPTGDLGS